MALEKLLKNIESLLSEIDKKNLEVSKVSVGWHLEHCLLIINGSLKGLTMSNPGNYNPKFSIKKFIFLTFRQIPRGKINAPKQFVPLEIATKDTIKKLLILANERLKPVENLPSKSYITHPFLGDLDKKTTLNFLEIHTNHHLKIVNDILKTNH